MGIAVAVGQVHLSVILNGVVFPQCDVVSVQKLCKMSSKDSILVVGRNASIPAESVSAFAVVLNSDNDINAEQWRGMSVITCGISGRNTVSVTSKTPEKITLSLNRSIHTLRGLCEPMELPVIRVDGIEDYDYMAAFAVSILLGNTLS